VITRKLPRMRGDDLTATWPWRVSRAKAPGSRCTWRVSKSRWFRLKPVIRCPLWVISGR